MEISVEDFNALAAEQSQRDVRIAQLEMELAQTRREHVNEVAALRSERDGLWAEKCGLEHRLEMLQTDFENVRFENHWMKQYILLSIEKVRAMFSHMRDIKLLSAVKAFILDMLPEDATPEQVALASNAMMLPMDEPTASVYIDGDYVVDKHVDNQVNGVASGATGIRLDNRTEGGEA